MSPTKPSLQSPFSLEVSVDTEGLSAVDWLAQHCDLSKQQLKDTMSKGAVWIQGSTLNKKLNNKPIQRIRRASKNLTVGDTLFIYYNEQVLSQQPPIAKLMYENQHYSVWFKPSGMLSHGSKWGDHCSITRWVEQHHQPQRTTFLVHRLDRAASGLILIAHHKKAAAALTSLFEQRQVNKYYQAVVHGEYLAREEVIDIEIDQKPAKSIVNSVTYDKQSDKTLVKVKIETGRKHQIRRHLSQTGYPIVGDRLYGRPIDSDSDINLQLRAYQLSFICPFEQKEHLFELSEDLHLSL